MKWISLLSTKTATNKTRLLTVGFLLFVASLIPVVAKLNGFYLTFSLIGALGCIVAWRLYWKAAAFSSAILLTSLIIFLVSGSYKVSAWDVFWIISLGVDAFLFSLCGEQYYVLKEKEHTILDEKINEVKSEYEENIAHIVEESTKNRDHKESLKKALLDSEDEIETMKSLIVTSKDEVDRYSDLLNQTKARCDELQKTIDETSIEHLDHQSVLEENKQLIQKLNEALFTNHQNKLLVESALEGGENSSSTKVSQAQSMGNPEEVVKLQDELASLKESYQEKLQEYKALKSRIQTFFTMDQLSSFRETSGVYEQIYEEFKTNFERLSEQLQECRMAIFKTEGQIVRSNGDNQEGSSTPGGYLEIADQECLRLEEENQMLMDFLKNAFAFIRDKISSS